jgi:hypothetical protein
METEPMPSDAEVVSAVEALLSETEAAHGAYESAELGGVYDQDWPAWYAAYAVDHGLGDVIGRDVTANDLAALLTRAYADFEATDRTETWQAYVARRIAEQREAGR